MLIFLDTETTGVGPEARLVQLAFKGMMNPDCYAQTFKPTTTIEIGAMATHHITNKDVEDCTEFAGSDLKEMILGYIKSGSIIVAHNAPFDIKILKNEGVVVDKFIDTLQIARHLLQDVESHSLQYLRYYFELYDIEAEAHDAIGDVLVLEKVFFKLVDIVKTKFGISGQEAVVEKLLELTNKPIIYEKLSFGKHKGIPLTEVATKDISYLRWLQRAESSKPKDMQNLNVLATLKYYL